MAKYEVTVDGQKFIVESDQELTEAQVLGYLKQSEDVQVADGFWDNALDVAGEAAAGFNRSVMWPIDTAMSAAGLPKATELARRGAQGATNMVRNVAGFDDVTFKDRNFMESGTARDMVQAAGNVAPAALALPQVAGRNLAKNVDAAAEFLGLGSTPAGQVVRGGQINPALPPPVAQMDVMPSPKVERDLALTRNSSDPARVPYRGEFSPTGELTSVVKDSAQKQAVKSGLPEDLVAIVAGATKPERRNMLRMVEVMGNADPVARAQSYPRNVLGESLAERVDVVLNMNRNAGRQLAQIERKMGAERLTPEQLQALSQGPMNDVLNTLAEMGVKFDPAKRTVSFTGTALELAPTSKAKVKSALGSLTGEAPTTALDIHRKKQALDELVDEWSASSPGGAAGRAGRIIKEARGKLNEFLRNRVDGYADANDAFSETVGVINDLNKLIGRSTDIRDADTAPALARMSRTILSNYQSSDKARNVLGELDRLASQSGRQFGDDFLRQNVFLDESERLLGTPLGRSLQGEVSKAVQFANEAKDPRGMASRVIDYAAEAFTPSQAEQRKKQINELKKLIRAGL